MLCSRCVLPVLALYLLLQETFAASLPSRFRNKREVDWQEVFSRLSDHSDTGDLSVGDAGEMGGRFGDGRPSHPETAADPTGHLPVQQQHQNQNQNRKAHEKRRKVAPMDSIGGFQMSSFRRRQDEPDIYWKADRN